MTRGRLAVHAHFYQPSRVDPWTGTVPEEPAAAPFHDWNARVDAECYRPLSARGTLRHISFDLGPTLAGWLATEDPETHDRFVGGSGAGDVLAQAYHHTILPLASAADRVTEVRWGLRDAEVRFGRRPAGLWLPETAVDTPTLRLLANEGVVYTILAPWQAAADGRIDTRRPYRVDLGGDRSIVVVFYDGPLSAAVSFEPEATSDADRFAREWVAPRFGPSPPASETADGTEGADPPLALIATDGELYGHHQVFRDLFLHRLVAPDPGGPDRGFDVVPLSDVVGEPADRPFARTGIVDRTSWSCHHGVARWSAECPDAHDGRWKGPLRAALDRLAGGIDVVTEGLFSAAGGDPDPWSARDTWIDVVLGTTTPADFAADRLGGADDDQRTVLLDLLEAQRWRLNMYASDGWFWDDPIRPETRQILRFAARAARIVDGLAGTRLEEHLIADLALLRSPGQGIDGAAIYRLALADVGQPAAGPPSRSAEA
jgi:hypothetical protein